MAIKKQLAVRGPKGSGSAGAEPEKNEELRAALADWRDALSAFDAAEEPLPMELASIRLEAAHRRFGCLAAQSARGS